MKRKILVSLVSFYILLSFSSCATVETILQEPVVSLHSVDITSITFNGTQLLCKVQIENPNPFDIPFPEVGWEFFINANSFVNGVIRNNQRLRARDTTLVEVPVNLDYLNIFNTFSSLRDRNNADYKVALAVKFAIPVLGDKVWNLEHVGNIPMLQIPRVNSPSMRIVRTDLTMVEFAVTVNVENPNAFQLPAPKINFDYRVNNTSILRNNFENRSPLAPSSVTPLVFGIAVYYSDLFRIIPGLRTSGSATGVLDMTFDFGIPAFRNENINLQIPGNLPLSR
jgi:LEA14-like dessication related protein